jgi:hypothetical protein
MAASAIADPKGIDHNFFIQNPLFRAAGLTLWGALGVRRPECLRRDARRCLTVAQCFQFINNHFIAYIL